MVHIAFASGHGELKTVIISGDGALGAGHGEEKDFQAYMNYFVKNPSYEVIYFKNQEEFLKLPNDRKAQVLAALI